MRPKLLLGAHFSISKGYHRAIFTAHDYGCSALQIFTKNASTWKERRVTDKEILLFRNAINETGIDVIAAHTSYLINLGSSDPILHKQSCNALTQEIVRAGLLGIPYIVMHPGFHKDRPAETGILQVAESLERILRQTADFKVRLLLENTAGQGSSLGWSFEQLDAMLSDISQTDRIGICLDTAHMAAAGYDIRNETAYKAVMQTFDRILGFKKLYLFHLNDSAKPIGSRVDRHEHIGEGAIGLEGFRLIMNDDRLAAIPKIIETPKIKDKMDADRLNLSLLRSLAKS